MDNSENTRERLERCFSAVFPDLSPDEIRRASPATVGAWDSLANVTLVTVIEEEFGLQLPLDDPDWAASFELILAHVNDAQSVG